MKHVATTQKFRTFSAIRQLKATTKFHNQNPKNIKPNMKSGHKFHRSFGDDINKSYACLQNLWAN